MKQQSLFFGKQVGLTLLEMMIALLLSLVLLAGVLQVFTGTGQAFRSNDSLSMLQENMRFATSRIQFEGRQAGFKGCLIGEPFNNLDTTHASYTPFVYNRFAVMGWEAQGTAIDEEFTNNTFTVGDADFDTTTGHTLPLAVANAALPGSDVFVVNSAQRLDLTLSGNPDATNANTINAAANTGIAGGTVLLVIRSDCTAGDLFQKTNPANAAAMVKGSGGIPGNQTPFAGGFSGAPYDNNARVYEYVSSAFFVGLGANAEPSLFMRRLDAGDPFGGVAIELVSGVENMQVLYGVAPTAGSRTAERYVPANEVNNWDQVVSFRVSMLMRSANGVEVERQARSFNMLGLQLTTENDSRARMLGSLTVGVRNRLQ